MNPVFKGYINFMDVVNRVVGWVMAIMLMIMTVLIAWQVFARFVVGDSLTFSEEIARFLTIWLTLLGSAYAVRKGTLMAVEALPDGLKGRPKARKIVKSVAYIISMVFYFILCRFGWEIAQTVSYQTAPATSISMFWPMLALCVGGGLMFLNTIVVLIEENVSKEVQ